MEPSLIPFSSGMEANLKCQPDIVGYQRGQGNEVQVLEKAQGQALTGSGGAVSLKFGLDLIA
ncbi:MAG TPA: hypothetical protein ENH62_09065 [Marinobacter sp.]|nr:hypothetical protein [Marinobacter sp.]